MFTTQSDLCVPLDNLSPGLLTTYLGLILTCQIIRKAASRSSANNTRHALSLCIYYRPRLPTPMPRHLSSPTTALYLCLISLNPLKRRLIFTLLRPLIPSCTHPRLYIPFILIYYHSKHSSLCPGPQATFQISSSASRKPSMFCMACDTFRYANAAASYAYDSRSAAAS